MREDKMPKKEGQISKKGGRKMNGWIITSVVIVVLVLGATAVLTSGKNSRGNKVLTDNLSAPLNGAKTAKVEIDSGHGNLTIGPLEGGGQVLADGTLQYIESLGMPTRTLETRDGQAILTLRAVKKSGFRFFWDACRGGAYLWRILLNPAVPSDLTAHSDGGYVELDLSGMAVTRVAADTGGGNVNVTLPESVANLSLTAKTGAGNVAVRVPGGIAARIQAKSGLGKVIVDPRFVKIDACTYQSPGYDEAANKVEITLQSGAGDVTVNTK